MDFNRIIEIRDFIKQYIDDNIFIGLDIERIRPENTPLTYILWNNFRTISDDDELDMSDDRSFELKIISIIYNENIEKIEEQTSSGTRNIIVFNGEKEIVNKIKLLREQLIYFENNNIYNIKFINSEMFDFNYPMFGAVSTFKVFYRV